MALVNSQIAVSLQLVSIADEALKMAIPCANWAIAATRLLSCSGLLCPYVAQFHLCHNKSLIHPIPLIITTIAFPSRVVSVASLNSPSGALGGNARVPGRLGISNEDEIGMRR